METLNTIDWAAWMGVAAAFVLAFDRLAKLTPTKADDEIVRNLYKVFAILGVKVKDKEVSKGMEKVEIMEPAEGGYKKKT